MEKAPPRRHDVLAIGLAVLRIWQLASAFLVYASFGLLYSYIVRHRLGENVSMRIVEVLGLLALGYSALVICCVNIFKQWHKPSWRAFAIASIPADILFMGLFLTKIVLLSIAGLPADCHGLTRGDYFGDDLVRQPVPGYSTIRFGQGTRDSVGELDRFCHFPRTVWAFSIIALFSYTFTILLTVLSLQQQRPPPDDNEKATVSEHIEEPAPEALPQVPDIPDIVVDEDVLDSSRRESSPTILEPSPPQGTIPSEEDIYNDSRPPSSHSQADRRSLQSRRSVSSWGATTLASDAESTRNTDYAAPPGPVEPAPSRTELRRNSTSTTSSYNADMYLVTDGFRPHHEPLSYSSRPSGIFKEPSKDV